MATKHSYESSAKCLLLAIIALLGFGLFQIAVGDEYEPCCEGTDIDVISASGSQAQSQSIAQSAGGVGVGGTSVLSVGNGALAPSITMNSEGTDLSKAIPPARAPTPTASYGNTCYGSTTFGVGVSGFGASGAHTWTDHDCIARMNAGFMNSIGYSDLALEILCSRPNVYEAATRIAKMRNVPSMCQGMNPEDANYNALMLQEEYERLADAVEDDESNLVFVDEYIHGRR